MADGLAVDTDSLLEAARVVGGLTGAVADQPVAAALRRAADALPGCRLAAAADAEAAGWTPAAAALTDLLAGHAADLVAAATTYRLADEALAAAARSAA